MKPMDKRVIWECSYPALKTCWKADVTAAAETKPIGYEQWLTNSMDQETCPPLKTRETETQALVEVKKERYSSSTQTATEEDPSGAATQMVGVEAIMDSGTKTPAEVQPQATRSTILPASTAEARAVEWAQRNEARKKLSCSIGEYVLHRLLPTPDSSVVPRFKLKLEVTPLFEDEEEVPITPSPQVPAPTCIPVSVLVKNPNIVICKEIPQDETSSFSSWNDEDELEKEIGLEATGNLNILEPSVLAFPEHQLPKIYQTQRSDEEKETRIEIETANDSDMEIRKGFQLFRTDLSILKAFTEQVSQIEVMETREMKPKSNHWKVKRSGLASAFSTPSDQRSVQKLKSATPTRKEHYV
jgi:hypothetical protein